MAALPGHGGWQEYPVDSFTQTVKLLFFQNPYLVLLCILPLMDIANIASGGILSL